MTVMMTHAQVLVLFFVARRLLLVPVVPLPHAFVFLYGCWQAPLCLRWALRGQLWWGGMVLHGRLAEQEGGGLRLPCCFCIKKLKVNPLVVYEDVARCHEHCIEYRKNRHDCILVGLLLTGFFLHCIC
jgi:hypothetical protein